MNKSENRIFEIAAVTILSFAAGLAAGMLFSPKSGRENREWISDQANHLGEWVNETGKKSVRRAKEELTELREKVHQRIDRTVPDLYAATENVALDENDLMAK
jgi:gas vesicle protein